MSIAERKAAAASTLHRDVYPVGRVAAEFFLRSFDLLCRLDDDIVNCLIITTLWHDALYRDHRDRNKGKPMSVRELSRRLDLPFETVRRHVLKLVRGGAGIAEKGSVTLTATMRRQANGLLRKIYLNAMRMLADLSRVKIMGLSVNRSPASRSRRLDREQTIIAVAAIGMELTAMKALRGFFDDDLMKGLVFTAIRTANVKHVTNTNPAANREILPDSVRLPVTVLAISDSMRLPYETVRRHAYKLVKEGKCQRIGRSGLLVPASAFQQMTVETNAVHKLVGDFVAEIRAAGVKI